MLAVGGGLPSDTGIWERITKTIARHDCQEQGPRHLVPPGRAYAPQASAEPCAAVASRVWSSHREALEGPPLRSMPFSMMPLGRVLV
jgi:hypothetical protein